MSSFGYEVTGWLMAVASYYTAGANVRNASGYQSSMPYFPFVKSLPSFPYRFARGLGGAGLVVALGAASGCSSSSAPATTPTGTTGSTNGTCSGDAAACVSGTLITRGFNVAFASSKVQLYSTFPYGKATPVTEAAVTADGKFAFSGADPAARYYLQGVARFTSGAGTFAVATVAGPFTLPLAAPADLKIRPVFLEALQQRPAGGALALSWASAHVYDPNTAAELTDAKVTLHADTQALDMPFATNLAGQKSYFVQLTKGPAPTSLGIDVAHTSFPGGASFTLAAEVPDFDPAVTAPADQAQIAAGQPLPVAWTANPHAAYAIVELFATNAAGGFDARYASDAPRGPAVASETIPGSALAAPGAYLLNVQMSRPSCPTTADGCVYNASTAAVNLTAK